MAGLILILYLHMEIGQTNRLFIMEDMDKWNVCSIQLMHLCIVQLILQVALVFIICIIRTITYYLYNMYKGTYFKKLHLHLRLNAANGQNRTMGEDYFF